MGLSQDHRETVTLRGDEASALAWVQQHSLTVVALDEKERRSQLIRRTLDVIAFTMNGTPAAATTIARKRAVFYGAPSYAAARMRRPPSRPGSAATLPCPWRGPPRTEFEYHRGGAMQYLAAWDVHRAKVFGRCEPTTGIEPFSRLVTQVMTTEPYASARRVFWVADNGSSHRGQAAARQLQGTWPALRLVHLPIHASWLNQIEVYLFGHPAQNPHPERLRQPR